MQVQITPQAKAEHHGPVNRNKYRGDPWESGIDNQQVTKYEGQKGSPGSSTDIAHPSTITRQGNDWHTMYKAKHWLRDYGKAIKCTYSGIEDTKQNDHLDEQASTARMGPQPGWLHKNRYNRNSPPYIPERGEAEQEKNPT
jgi:hypothetical protein